MSNVSPEQIKASYVNRCKELTFSSRLKNPTDANVKKECLALYRKKNGLIDKYIILNFLGLQEEDVVISLKKADPEKFRPIVYFLKDKTADPRNETIELVAWLIDFKFESSEKISEDSTKDVLKLEKEDQEKGDSRIDDVKKNDDDIKKDKTDKVLTGEEIPKEKKPIFKEKAAIAVLITVVLTITSGLAALLFSNQKSTTPFLNFTGQEKYMYWLGDHYQPTNKSQIKGVNIVPFNAKMVTYFKKITDPDTLTIRSIGKVWYVKINNKLEFYTAIGFHPGDTLKRLKPLTKYIVERYTQRNKNVLIFINLIFYLSLLICFYNTYILYKKRQKKRLTFKT